MNPSADNHDGSLPVIPGHTVTRRDALKLFGLGAGVTAIAAVAGCAPSGKKTGSSTTPAGSTGSASSGGSTSPAGVAPSAQAPGKFKFTAWSLNEEASKPAVQKIVDGYEKATGATIDTASYPYDSYLNQLVLQVTGGQASGAAQLDIAWLATLAATGKLADLGDAASSGGYTAAALASGQSGGKQYGLPWTTGSIGMIANKALLQQAGITTMPKTTDEFEAALAAVKKLGNGIVPYAGITKPAELKDILQWMQTFGSPLVDSSGNLAIGDQGSVDAVTWYKKLYDAKYISPDVGRADARVLFSKGKAAFYDDAIVAKGILSKQAKDPNFMSNVVPIPRPTHGGGKPVSRLWGHVIIVFAGDDASAATGFAKYATSDQATVLQYFKDVALPPTTTAALASDDVKNDEWVSTWENEVTVTATPDPFWPFAQFAQIETELAKQVQAVLIGQAKPQAAMTAAANTIKPLMKS
jgi:multiple sugar transport system substrate-binding protein